MLKETDTEEIIRLFCHIFFIGGISIWGGGSPGYAYEPKCCSQFNDKFNDMKDLSSS